MMVFSKPELLLGHCLDYLSVINLLEIVAPNDNLIKSVGECI